MLTHQVWKVGFVKHEMLKHQTRTFLSNLFCEIVNIVATSGLFYTSLQDSVDINTKD